MVHSRASSLRWSCAALKGAVAFMAWTPSTSDVAASTWTRTLARPARLSAMRAALRFVVDLGLPPLCPACREPVGDPGGLCAACWSQLSFIAPPYCERLGIPFAYDPGPGILSMAGDRRSAGLWPRPRRRALRRCRARPGACVQIRRPPRPRARPWAAGWRAPAANCSPTPMRWSRCRCIGGGCGRAASTRRRRLPGRFREKRRAGRSTTCCGASRATRQQVGLAQAERATNVQGAFRVPAEGKADVRGRRLVLVDDVLNLRRHRR